MSVIARQQVSSNAASVHDAGERTPSAAPARRLELAWSVSRAALLKVADQSVAKVVQSATTPRDGMLRLVCVMAIDASDARERAMEATLTLCDGAGRTLHTLRRGVKGRALRDEVGGDVLWHIEAPEAIVCTLRGTQVLYATTPLLADLGLAGGRYDVPATADCPGPR